MGAAEFAPMVARGPFVTRGAALHMRESAGRSSPISSGEIPTLRRAVFLSPDKNRRLERAGGYLTYETGAPQDSSRGVNMPSIGGAEGSILLVAS